jgi:SAM-dependent methyltransferase
MTKQCPICSETALKRPSDESWTLDGTTYYLLRCEGCQTAFTNPLPSDDVLNHFYQTSFNYRWYSDHLKAKLKDARIRFSEYKALLRGSILDFGGGLGYFSQVCRSNGHKSITYDLYSSNNPTNEKWDALVALHVLEHTNDPNELVLKFKALLNPGGRLIVAVPNYGGIGYRSQGMHWVWAQPPFLHIFHFTANGLSKLLERHGFVDMEISYHDRWDANTYCDVNHPRSSRKFDAAWSLKPFNAAHAYRKLVALINTYRRFRGLRKSSSSASCRNDFLSEIQITAIAPLDG